MMPEELLRIVDVIHREKEIDKEVIFQGIEAALAHVSKKSSTDEIEVSINRDTGTLSARDKGTGEPVTIELGRIAAQSAKQIIFQKIREAEADIIHQEFVNRNNSIANGIVQRFEGSSLIVNLGKTEGILPRDEQVKGENYKIGDRIRAYILSVDKSGARVQIILSRKNPLFVQKLFEFEVPEIAEKFIQIKAMAREAGYRTKLAVISTEAKIDCVGACVGVRGSRIKNIIEELNGEKIDIIRWNDSIELLVMNALKPAEISGISLDKESRRATVLVADDQLSLAIGKRGQNVRLATRLTGWDIDIVTESQEMAKEEHAMKELTAVPEIGTEWAEKLFEAGYATLADIVSRGQEALGQVEGISLALAEQIFTGASLLQQKQAATPDVPTPAPPESATPEPSAPETPEPESPGPATPEEATS